MYHVAVDVDTNVDTNTNVTCEWSIRTTSFNTTVAHVKTKTTEFEKNRPP